MSVIKPKQRKTKQTYAKSLVVARENIYQAQDDNTGSCSLARRRCCGVVPIGLDLSFLLFSWRRGREVLSTGSAWRTRDIFRLLLQFVKGDRCTKENSREALILEDVSMTAARY